MDRPLFAQSALWDGQARFFRELGPDAWDGRVPYHATNNVNIAASVAQIALAFMRDCASRHLGSAEPIPVVEIGAGIGRFGYQFIRALSALKQELPGVDVRFVYWMTDASEATLDFLRGHPPLAAMIRDGLLRLALYDPTGAEPPVERTGHPTGAARGSFVHAFEQPAIVVANYLFDSLPVDVLRVARGEPFILTASGTPDLTETQGMNAVRRLDELGLDVQWRPLQSADLASSDHGTLLREIVERREDGWATVPSAGFRCLDALRALSPHGYLFLTTDKGLLPTASPLVPLEPKVVLHGGAVSMSVNFPLLARQVERTGGWVASQSSRQSLTTVLFNTTAPWEALPQTRFWLQHALNEQGHAHLFNLYQLLSKRQQELGATLPSLLSLFNLLRWDPHTVSRLWPAVCAALEQSTREQRRELAHGIRRSVDLFYPLPGEADDILDKAEAYFDWLAELEDA
jgi:hypothetical protein